MFLRGERKLLERSFPFPTPLSFKNFETGVLFFAVMPALNVRTTYVRTAYERLPPRGGSRRSRVEESAQLWILHFFRRSCVISTARRLLPSRTRRDTFLSEEGSLLVLSPKPPSMSAQQKGYPKSTFEIPHGLS